MTSCDLDTSVPDWIIEHPETLAVCRERGRDAEVVLSKLLRYWMTSSKSGGYVFNKESGDGNYTFTARRGH